MTDRPTRNRFLEALAANPWVVLVAAANPALPPASMPALIERWSG